MSHSVPLAVRLDDRFESECRHLATQLSLPLVSIDSEQNEFPFFLQYGASGLALQQAGRGAPGPVQVDFAAGAADYRRRRGGGELIVKAVGGRPGSRPDVVDATAGLGRDSFVLACQGYSVTLCERSAVIAALLADGLVRARASADAELMAALERMVLAQGEAVEYLQRLTPQQRPGVVVMDPMFPESGKSARVKKEMQAFHAVIGTDSDSADLLQVALESAKYRVVVKRPIKAPYLADRKPAFSKPGKAIRFDVYTIRRLPE